MALTATIQDHLEAQRIRVARTRGATDADVALAQQSGIDPSDVVTLRQFTAERSLIIVTRCPKAAALGLHGTFPAKTGATAQKSGSSGAVVRPRTFIVGPDGVTTLRPSRIMVSDYDLMSVWRRGSTGLEKLHIGEASGKKKRGTWPAESRDTIRALNGMLVTKIQHGAQDDYHVPSAKHPNVKPDDRFAAFELGAALFLPDYDACRLYYGRIGAPWPYDLEGRYLGPATAG